MALTVRLDLVHNSHVVSLTLGVRGELLGDAGVLQVRVGDEGSVPGQENQVTGRVVRTDASNTLSAISPALVNFVDECFDACNELGDNLFIASRSEDSWCESLVLAINLGLEEPVHFVNLVCISAHRSVLLAEVVENGLALVLLSSIDLDPGWERTAYRGVRAGSFDCGPFLPTDAHIFVLDVFESEEIANSLRASLQIKVDKFGFSTSFGHRVCLCD